MSKRIISMLILLVLIMPMVASAETTASPDAGEESAILECVDLETGISPELEEALTELSGILPAKMTQAVRELGYTVFVMTEKSFANTVIKPNGFEPTTGGFVDPWDPYVYIRDTGDVDETKIIYVHELGHVLDIYLKRISASKEFIDIFDAEKDSFGSSEFFKLTKATERNLSNTMELFASAVSGYVIMPENLEEECPRLYAFLESLFEEEDAAK